MQHLQVDTVKKLPFILSLQVTKGHVLCTFFFICLKIMFFFYGKWFFLSPWVTLTPVWPLFSYHLRGSAWYSSPHLHGPWVHFALCENYWSGALQSEIWLLRGEHLPCTILICWIQWEAKINFHIVFSARRIRACEEKPRRRSFWQNASLNKIPLLLTKATGRSGHLKGARCNCSFEKDTVGGRVQYLQPCRIRAHISAKLI